MNNAPVYFAIGQVQHNPLLSLDSYVPVIQESMRKSGYPDFSKGLQLGFNLTANVASDGGGQVQPPTVRLERYFFLNAGKSSGFVLLANSFSFQTTEYGTFEEFLEEFQRGLEVVQQAVGGLSFVERIGLRYLDALVPREGETFRDYLATELLGLPARMPEQTFSYSFTEASLQITDGQVISRTIAQNGPLGFPPDLHPQPLQMAERFRGLSGEHAIIDTDGSLSARKSFDLNDVKRSLESVHAYVEKTFTAMTTDHARSVWYGKDG
jgi:uncharacterized protein (TIGR04255 family)